MPVHELHKQIVGAGYLVSLDDLKFHLNGCQTVAWLFERLGDVLWSRALIAMKGQTFDAQEKAICDLLDLGVRPCSVDQSGLGMMLAERLAKKYSCVEPEQFTAQVKKKLARLVKQRFEDRLVRIPDNREVRADINAVKRSVTPAGNVRFDAEHTDKGHADRFRVLGLAAETAGQPVAHLSDGVIVGTPRAAEWMPAARPAEFWDSGNRKIAHFAFSSFHFPVSIFQFPFSIFEEEEHGHEKTEAKVPDRCGPREARPYPGPSGEDRGV